MEPLWSPVVATGGNRSQIGHVDKPPKQAKTVAVRCDRLPEGAHGKGHVDATPSLLKRGSLSWLRERVEYKLSAGRASSMATVTDRKSRNVGCRVRRGLVPSSHHHCVDIPRDLLFARVCTSLAMRAWLVCTRSAERTHRAHRRRELQPHHLRPGVRGPVRERGQRPVEPPRIESR
jgi:hypothetical protein